MTQNTTEEMGTHKYEVQRYACNETLHFWWTTMATFDTFEGASEYLDSQRDYSHTKLRIVAHFKEVVRYVDCTPKNTVYLKDGCAVKISSEYTRDLPKKSSEQKAKDLELELKEKMKVCNDMIGDLQNKILVLEKENKDLTNQLILSNRALLSEVLKNNGQ
jgi:hypothetical protein